MSPRALTSMGEGDKSSGIHLPVCGVMARPCMSPAARNRSLLPEVFGSTKRPRDEVAAWRCSSLVPVSQRGPCPLRSVCSIGCSKTHSRAVAQCFCRVGKGSRMSQSCIPELQGLLCHPHLHGLVPQTCMTVGGHAAERVPISPLQKRRRRDCK